MSRLAAGFAALAVLTALPGPGRGADRWGGSPASAGRLRRRRGRGRRQDGASGTGGTAMLLDLVAAVLASGASPARTLELVADALEVDGDPAATALRAVRRRLDAPDAPTPTTRVMAAASSAAVPAPGRLPVSSAVDRLESALRLAATAGLPPAGIVHAAAADLRRDRAAAQSRAAARLAVLLVLPGGLCLLPAFMALGVAPLVIDLLQRAI